MNNSIRHRCVRFEASVKFSQRRTIQKPFFYNHVEKTRLRSTAVCHVSCRSTTHLYGNQPYLHQNIERFRTSKAFGDPQICVEDLPLVRLLTPFYGSDINGNLCTNDRTNQDGALPHNFDFQTSGTKNQKFAGQNNNRCQKYPAQLYRKKRAGITFFMLRSKRIVRNYVLHLPSCSAHAFVFVIVIRHYHGFSTRAGERIKCKNSQLTNIFKHLPKIF